MNEIRDDYSVVDSQARLWPQTERLRAALLFGDGPAALEALNVLRRYLNTPRDGVWRDRLGADDTFVVEPAPASSLYHLAGAWREAGEIGLCKASMARGAELTT